MSSFSQVYDIQNLNRAYRWILSYPDARYKNYFRDGYAAYALASKLNLKFLQRRMREGTFTPSNASKVYIPKPSGILRPISLLAVNDQVAYQACVNVIAEELEKRVAKRHGRTVFFHMYAGRSSPFFYRKWEDCYSAYANAIRLSFRSGLKYVASFDLTAFYDSIDHHVLRVFLQRSGVDPDTIDFLLRSLRHWTEATWAGGANKLIYQGHGIPQGPSPSGMLSEVVLQHLDGVGDRPSKDVRYLRYVDDIKIFAKDDKTLRRKLAALDIASKEIGLFPQGSKIAIRKLASAEEEIKSVSIPPEVAAAAGANQNLIRRRVRALAKVERDWWTLQRTLGYLDENKYGRPSFESLMNLGLRGKESDPARIAASVIFVNSLAVHAPTGSCNWEARVLLRNVGFIPYAGRPPSLIPDVLAYTIKFQSSYDWRKFFGNSHGAAERLAILCKQRFETDIDAFIVSLDSFCDFVMRKVFEHRGFTMNTAYGNVLGAGAPGWLTATFPLFLFHLSKLHQLRIRSFTAHPRHLRTGALNKRITHAQYYKIRKGLLAAFSELATALPM